MSDRPIHATRAFRAVFTLLFALYAAAFAFFFVYDSKYYPVLREKAARWKR